MISQEDQDQFQVQELSERVIGGQVADSAQQVCFEDSDVSILYAKRPCVAKKVLSPGGGCYYILGKVR